MGYKYIFPSDFIWGTATSAHQTEGYNTNSDWWKWEVNKKANNEFPKEPSEIACDSYKRYKEDLDLCVELNNNAVRLSVEWARIEPEQGKFSQDQINHYKEVLKEAQKRGLKTFATLHHFTNPIWFADKGGWENFNSPKLFAEYAKKCAEEFGSLIDIYLTINEPQVYALNSYFSGTWPPNKRNQLSSLIVQINMMRAHRKSYSKIKKINPNYQVGIVKHLSWHETDPYSKSNPIDKTAVKILNFISRDFFLRPIKAKLDLIGINYYSTRRIENLKIKNPKDYVSDMGWWINPDGLEKLLVYLNSYKLPMYVTENGLADAQDKYRANFIKDHLISCGRALGQEALLKGYFYWSLIDNYEWHQGFWPKFGLVEIDRKNNLKRNPRKSFYYYSQICKNNEVTL